jgi:hypothetical protein
MYVYIYIMYIYIYIHAHVHRINHHHPTIQFSFDKQGIYQYPKTQDRITTMNCTCPLRFVWLQNPKPGPTEGWT